jgi:hypothetical protein
MYSYLYVQLLLVPISHTQVWENLGHSTVANALQELLYKYQNHSAFGGKPPPDVII